MGSQEQRSRTDWLRIKAEKEQTERQSEKGMGEEQRDREQNRRRGRKNR